MAFLWITLKHKTTEFQINACFCYLPPDGSTWQVDAHAFVDALLAGIYEYQNNGTVLICGDFNSRCGDIDDFITGVDELLFKECC